MLHWVASTAGRPLKFIYWRLQHILRSDRLKFYRASFSNQSERNRKLVATNREEKCEVTLTGFVANCWISTIFFTETSVCIVERWKKGMGYRFVPECNDAQESRACHLFVFFFCFFVFVFVCICHICRNAVCWDKKKIGNMAMWLKTCPLYLVRRLPTSTIVAWVRVPGSTHFVCWVCGCLSCALFFSGYPSSFHLSSKTNMSKFQFHVESITNLKDRATLRSSGSSVLGIAMCHLLWSTCKVVRQTVCKSVVLLSR